jgi:phosphoglycolate phosphatase
LDVRNAEIRGVVFDKDGTLFDFAKTWEAWAVSLLDRLTSDADAAWRMGQAIGFDTVTGRFERQSVVIAGTAREVARALSDRLPHMSVPEIVALLNEESALAPQAEAVPLAPLLETLHDAGFRLGLATNDAEGPARAHLAAVGIMDHFDFIAGFDSGHGGKPAPGQLLAFAAATGLQPDNCVMVGDSRHDLSAGRAAGFATVGVLTGMALEDELAELADVVLPDIGHLHAWLSGHG